MLSANPMWLLRRRLLKEEWGEILAFWQSTRSIVARIRHITGRVLSRIARILMIVVGGLNGGRSADPSARSLYEPKKKDYRP
jgi:hypothetical protein